MVRLFYKVTISCIWVLGVGLQLIDFWDHGLESRGLLCLCVVQVAASATGWSLVQRSHTECVRLILCGLETPKMRRPKPELAWGKAERKSSPLNANSRTSGQQTARPLWHTTLHYVLKQRIIYWIYLEPHKSRMHLPNPFLQGMLEFYPLLRHEVAYLLNFCTPFISASWRLYILLTSAFSVWSPYSKFNEELNYNARYCAIFLPSSYLLPLGITYSPNKFIGRHTKSLFFFQI